MSRAIRLLVVPGQAVPAAQASQFPTNTVSIHNFVDIIVLCIRQVVCSFDEGPAQLFVGDERGAGHDGLGQFICFQLGEHLDDIALHSRRQVQLHGIGLVGLLVDIQCFDESEYESWRYRTAELMLVLWQYASDQESFNSFHQLLGMLFVPHQVQHNGGNRFQVDNHTLMEIHQRA